MVINHKVYHKLIFYDKIKGHISPNKSLAQTKHFIVIILFELLYTTKLIVYHKLYRGIIVMHRICMVVFIRATSTHSLHIRSNLQSLLTH